MLRPNDKDIIDVIVDDKRGAARREGDGATFSRKAARAVGPVSVPRTNVSSNRNNGSDSHARTQARELLARIRRDAAAAHSKAAAHEELAPRTAAIVSPAEISITAGECGRGAAPAPRDHAEGPARESRGPKRERRCEPRSLSGLGRFGRIWKGFTAAVPARPRRV